MPALTNKPDDTFSLKERLNSQKFGGTMLLLAALVAMILANSPLSGWYEGLKQIDLPIPAIGIEHMSVAHWASDGILAVFFFVVGLELKREFVTGQLRDPRKASLPMAAALGGMIVPAIIFAVTIAIGGQGGSEGWAIPVATDIAFCVGLLAVFGKGLPSPFRIFLLTLAVVDDLLGITLIAIFYTANLNLVWLLVSIATIALYGLLVNKGVYKFWLLIPLGILAWYFMLLSGVHATIAGVLLGLTVPAIARKGEEISFAEDMEHDWNPLSQAIALPVFAFFAAGVPLAAGSGSFTDALANPVFLAAFLGLLVGKPLGIFTTVALLHKLPAFRLDDNLNLRDIAALGGLAGIGFTVSLLIGELAFRGSEGFLEFAHLGVILGSLTAAVISIFLLRWRVKFHVGEKLDPDEAVMP
ncbi:Na+/H+ antiporter NhaA [Gulosibacter bifidus]|uniref:Na(+)/H(+) antiporter NhaA n=1 Tax=Gulosibacter bifidus TaxID=272239 RepID=A0ABW5RJA4_9MICO|nr:Na+/H+ antiporter NhaA [Gulosibacter bifidus]